MVISNTHQKIDALRKIVPGGFVFVMDTTDRSFVYKSTNNPDCEQQIISLDKSLGIDTLTKFTDFYSHESDESIVKLKRIDQNTFIGLCAAKHLFSLDQLNSVESCLKFNN